MTTITVPTVTVPTVTVPATAGSSTAPASPPVTVSTRRLFGQLIRSESCKLFSLRSTPALLGAGAASMIGFGIAVSASRSTSLAPLDPVGTSLSGLFAAQLAFGALGALSVTAEHGSGALATTFLAAPQRRLVLLARATVAGGAVAVTGVTSSLVAFAAGQATLGHHGVGLGAPGSLRAVVGAGAFLGLLAVLAVGLGAVVRSTAGSLAALFVLLFVAPVAAAALPATARGHVMGLLPTGAGQALTATVRAAGVLTPATGLALITGCAAAGIAAALLLVNRRGA
jgi:ABC-2 type transport system permease protein